MDWRLGLHWGIVVDNERSLFLHFHFAVIRHQDLDILFRGQSHCLTSQCIEISTDAKKSSNS